MSFQALQVWLAFGFPSHSGRSFGNELARRREDVENSSSHFLVMVSPVRLAFSAPPPSS